jgi:hydroxyacylglutathione hydrolase
MKLVALPAFTDNYIWMIHDGRQALVVDPGDATPVLAHLQAHGLALTAILVTHHHMDHIGGLTALQSHLQGPVWGPADCGPVALSHPVDEGQRLAWNGLDIEVWHTPGHTANHLSYRAQVPLDGQGTRHLLWCGDTLFSAGCGRIFDGTAVELHASLQRIAGLPDDTLVCCTHEYTAANLAFAVAAEPDNLQVLAAQQRAWALRAAGHPTLPTPLGEERQINPFLRTSEPTVVQQARHHGAPDDLPLSVFTALRLWKNEFKA